MAAGCCGTKKQKLNNCCGVNSNIGTISNGHASTDKIIHPEMGYFCFDVLYAHLHSIEPPKTPNFSNDLL